MRHNAIKTFDGKTAATIDQLSAVSLTRPAGDANLHLQLQYSQEGDFSDAVEAILTSVEADCGKVRFFDGEASAAFPADGLSDDYAGQRVVVDLSAVPLQVWLRYRWYAASGEPSGAWRGLYHPSSGGVEEGVSSTPTTPTNGYLKVNTDGADGLWSVDGGVNFHNAGETVTFPAGSYTVTFSAVSGYIKPANISATVTAGQTTTVTGVYVVVQPDPYSNWGYLQVEITGTPDGRWSIDDGTTWHESGTMLYLTVGEYMIAFMSVTGYTAPATRAAVVLPDQVTEVTVTYLAGEVSRDPADYGMTWLNGTEPSVIDPNKVIYVTPGGAGSKDGSSWANAKAGIYTAMLAANDGDVLYLQEGTYTNHLAPVAATKSIGIYGGFTVADGTWATRDGFANPTTIDATSNPTVPFIKPESGVTQVVDGIACTGFTGGVMLANGGTATVKNCAIYDCDCTASSHAVDNCLILNCTGSTGAATDCVFVKVDTSGSITGGNATDCIFLNCSASTIIYGAATGCTLENCETRGLNGCVKDNAEDCTFTNCNSNIIGTGYISCIVYGDATNCTFTNCSSSCYEGNYHDTPHNPEYSSYYSFSYIVYGVATNCILTNCSTNNGNRDGDSSIVSGAATNCALTNCTSIGGYNTNNRMVYGGADNCTFTNCCATKGRAGIASGGATNCTFTNCSGVSNTYSYIVESATNCTIIHCVADSLRWGSYGHDVTNCVVFDCDIDTIDFGNGTNNAAPAYIDANTLVLGTDNTLAKFASIGTVETIGYSETLNNTPAADFGDFRPLVGSILIGAGVAVEGVTTDITGATRANPPTIGAYEYQTPE